MKIIDESGIWYLEAVCIGNDYSLDKDDQVGCYTRVILNEDDIFEINYQEYDINGKPFSFMACVYGYTCPKCGKTTIIRAENIPNNIKERISSRSTTVIKKVYMI